MPNLTVPSFRLRIVQPDRPPWREAPPGLPARVFATIRMWVARRHGRQDLQDLAEHGEDHLLEDIGVTREDAFRVAGKWFWQR